MRKAAPEVDAVATKLREIGISAPYASQLARNVRQPSRAMAIRIFRDAGLRMGELTGASEAEIRVLEKYEPERAA